MDINSPIYMDIYGNILTESGYEYEHKNSSIAEVLVRLEPVRQVVQACESRVNMRERLANSAVTYLGTLPPSKMPQQQENPG